MKYMWKVLQELSWAHFFGCPYRSNGNKIHMDAALEVFIPEVNCKVFSKVVSWLS